MSRDFERRALPTRDYTFLTVGIITRFYHTHCARYVTGPMTCLPPNFQQSVKHIGLHSRDRFHVVGVHAKYPHV